MNLKISAKNLFKEFTLAYALEDIQIPNIAYHANKVKENGVFVALKGLKQDGHKYIKKASDLGAKFIVVQDDIKQDIPNSHIIKVDDTRLTLAKLARRFYQNPAKKLFITGIVGTNGKTSTSYILENILKAKKIKTGVIGTINYRFSDKVFESSMTTPESLDLQKILFDMQQEEISHVIIEVSSHGIDFKRVLASIFDILIFTNFSQDHLDYHKNMQNYFECKKKIFVDAINQEEKKTNFVININNEKGYELYSLLKDKRKTITIGEDISFKDIFLNQEGVKGKICIKDECLDFKSSAIGNYNLENIACATGAACFMDIDKKNIISAIKDFKVPGRLEKISNDKDLTILIDYAHTEDALLNVLSTLDKIKEKKLIIVFGCGGNRDKSKRAKMGAVAEKFCDFIIITSDNPRNENPYKIIEDIEKGILNKDKYIICENRDEAIKMAINKASKKDIILIAGKGHENYQIIKDKKINFSDSKIIIKHLKNKQ